MSSTFLPKASLFTQKDFKFFKFVYFLIDCFCNKIFLYYCFLSNFLKSLDFHESWFIFPGKIFFTTLPYGNDFKKILLRLLRCQKCNLRKTKFFYDFKTWNDIFTYISVIETFTSQIGNSRVGEKSFSEKSWFMRIQLFPHEKW